MSQISYDIYPKNQQVVAEIKSDISIIVGITFDGNGIRINRFVDDVEHRHEILLFSEHPELRGIYRRIIGWNMREVRSLVKGIEQEYAP